jgi:hypothetical protein
VVYLLRYETSSATEKCIWAVLDSWRISPSTRAQGKRPDRAGTVRREQRGTERLEAVEALRQPGVGPGHLGIAPGLDVPGGDVVDDGDAGHVRPGTVFEPSDAGAPMTTAISPSKSTTDSASLGRGISPIGPITADAAVRCTRGTRRRSAPISAAWSR